METLQKLGIAGWKALGLTVSGAAKKHGEE